MRAILIDPKLHRIHDIELAGVNDRQWLDQTRKLIGCNYLDSARVNEAGDTIWVDDGGFKKPTCFAFKISDIPFSGTGIVVGCDRAGRTQPPRAPIPWWWGQIDWLDEIVPELIPVESVLPGGGKRISIVVTWSRAGKHQ